MREQIETDKTVGLRGETDTRIRKRKQTDTEEKIEKAKK